MRTEFHDALGQLTTDLGAMCELATRIMQSATASLVDGDRRATEQTSADLAQLDQLDTRISDRAFLLLALQSPVARDLRLVVSAIQIAADAHRMGGLAANIARVARRHHREPVIPTAALDHFAAMGRVAVDLAGQVTTAVITCDGSLATRIQDDGSMDDLHRQLFALVTDRQWTGGSAAAAEAVLLGRFYGRFADHVVEIARRVVFQASGRLPFTLGS